MANDESASQTPARPRYVPVVSPEERARSNQELLELLESWVRDGDEKEQKETAAILREAEERKLATYTRNHGR
jgi:hypothetical protein